MLGRTTYTRAELDHARAAISEQMAAYQRLVRAVDASGEERATSSLRTFEPHFFNDLVQVLHRYFAHRTRAVAGTDENPLNEVELLSESLTTNAGILRGSTAVASASERSVLGLELGTAIRLSADQFARLSRAFFVDLEAKFLQHPAGG
jgi:hypothetical protein